LEEGEDFAALGLRVRTTLDVEKQAAANEAVRKHLRDYDARHNLYRPVDHLAPDQLAARRREAMRKIAGDLKPQEVYLAVVTKVSAQKMTVAVGDWEGSLEPSERVNPEGRPLDQLYALGDLLRVVVSGPVARGAEVVRFSFAPGPQAALVGMDVETRHVEALVGGYDYASSNFNRATQAKRQTGSAFKPVIYAAALLEHATTPATLWDDAPFPIRLDDGKTWSPKNSDGKFLGPLPLREALALSRNVVAVRLLDRVGLEKAQQFARALGITSPLVDNLTMGLGSSEIPVLELTNAYTTFATLGLRAEPVFILSIHDAYGQPLYEAPAVEPEIALGQDIAWLTVDMMTSVLTRGTASKIGKQLKRPAAGKTGTTNEGRDAWFIGFTPQKIATAWMGYDDNTPLGKNASGGTLSAPIWLDYMQAAHRGLPSAEFPRPAVGIVSAKIDPATGLLATDEHKKAREEFFLTDTAPTEYAPVEGESTTTDFLLEQ
jgi:penicillin-binding protein 1A